MMGVKVWIYKAEIVSPKDEIEYQKNHNLVNFTDCGTVISYFLDKREVMANEFFDKFNNMINSGVITSCKKDLVNNKFTFEYNNETCFVNLTEEQIRKINNGKMDNDTEILFLLFDKIEAKEKERLKELEKQKILESAKSGIIPNENAKKIYQEYLLEEIVKNKHISIDIKDIITTNGLKGHEVSLSFLFKFPYYLIKKL